jgi:adenosine deaminase
MFVDNHRHFSGSIKSETIWEIIQKQDRLDIAKSLDDVRQQVEISDNDFLFQFDYFSTRFNIFNKIVWDDWAIELAAKQLCSDLIAENIGHTTLTVSLNKFDINRNLADTGERVFGILSKVAADYHVSMNFLLSISYTWPKELQVRTLKSLNDLRYLVVGVDFVADETMAEWSLYPDLLIKWRRCDKVVRAHVGERPGTSSNIDIAVNLLKVSRIAHGIYATREQQIDASNHNIVFDMSISSNIYTKAIQNLSEHPLKQMQQNGCAITIGTDDPVQFNCTLKKEYELAKTIGADTDELYETAMDSRIIG